MVFCGVQVVLCRCRGFFGTYRGWNADDADGLRPARIYAVAVAATREAVLYILSCCAVFYIHVNLLNDRVKKP